MSTQSTRPLTRVMAGWYCYNAPDYVQTFEILRQDACGCWQITQYDYRHFAEEREPIIRRHLVSTLSRARDWVTSQLD